jgi:hypothetical protein
VLDDIWLIDFIYVYERELKKLAVASVGVGVG